VYRNQWPKIQTTYQSYLISYDHYVEKQHLGIGLQCGVDQAGTGGLRTTIINPSFAYETKLSKTISVRFGVQPGVLIKSVQFDKLLFGDQLARGGNTGASSITTVEPPTQSRAMFDIGAGTLLYSSKFWIGASVFHLTQPNESLYADDGSRLPIKYSVHGGNKFMLNEDEKDPDLKKSISAVMNYRGQGEFDQLDVGFYFSQRGFSTGLWYRGLPGIKAYKPGYSNDDAVAVILGFQRERLSIGYSYDITISKLKNLTKGANEVTLSYQFCKIKPKKANRVLVSCPKF
jgi:type IX secretion system PorP/SprF family membrane protein